MRLSRVYLTAICIVLLAGCGSFGQPKEKLVYERENVFIPIVCPPPSKPQPLKTKPLNPTAVQDQAGIWWVGFTPDEYGNMAINLEESIRFIKDQRGDIKYYATCVADFNKIVEDKNSEADTIEDEPDE